MCAHVSHIRKASRPSASFHIRREQLGRPNAPPPPPPHIVYEPAGTEKNKLKTYRHRFERPAQRIEPLAESFPSCSATQLPDHELN